MEKLPAELLFQIFEHLSNDDIINLPALITTRDLSDAEATRRYHTLWAWMEKGSLERLVQASKHKAIAKYATKITFTPERLLDLNERQYLHEIWNKCYYHGSRMKPEDLSLDNLDELVRVPLLHRPSRKGHFDQYRSLVDTQTLMEADGSDVKMLKCVFDRSSNLNTVAIHNRDWPPVDTLQDTSCLDLLSDSDDPLSSRIL